MEQESRSQPSIAIRLLEITVLAVLYFVVAKTGLSMASDGVSVSPVWPPTSVSLAAVILLGYRILPGIAIGAFFANLWVFIAGGPPVGTCVLMSLIIAIGNTLEAATGAFLIRRYTVGRDSFNQAQDIFKSVALAVMLATTVGATISAASLCLGGIASWRSFSSIWWTSWVGNTVGALILTPALLVWIKRTPGLWRSYKLIEAFLLFGLLSVISWFSFRASADQIPRVPYELRYLIIPMIAWASFRFRQCGAAIAIVIVATIAIWHLGSGLGLLASQQADDLVSMPRTYLAVITVTTLTLAGILTDRKRMEEVRLKITQQELEESKQVVEEKLEQTDSFLKNILESSSSVSIISTDLERNILYWNTGAENIFGYKAKEMVGSQKINILYPDETQTIKKIDSVRAALLAGEKEAICEVPEITKDGRIIWISLTLTPRLDDNGQVIGILGIGKDITERKLVKEKEKEHNRDLTFLSKTAMKFVELSSETDIYQFIGEKLKELASDSIVVIASFDSSADSFYVRAVLGVGEHTDAVMKLLGRDVVGMSVKRVGEVKLNFSGNKLLRFPGEIHELTQGQIPEAAAHTLKGILGVDSIYYMGFTADGELFGAAIIITRRGSELENRGIMETFINHSSVALRRWAAEEQINASLKEKEVLLREIHHRVKNNLQIISSLLNLQSRYIKDEQARQIFRESQNRVRSMALIHEKLYQSKNLAEINFVEYVEDLVGYLFRMYETDSHEVRLEIDVDDISLDVDTALPCGLIINELITNSLKHAFPDGNPDGKIHIDFRGDDYGKLRLIVSDNGVGFPENLDFRKTESLGLRLVNTLVRQLNGNIELDRKTGTAFKLTFANQNMQGRGV